MEKCLCPIFSRQSKLIEELLEKYTETRAEKKVESLRKDDRQKFVFLLIALLKFYRKVGAVEKWKVSEKQFQFLEQDLSNEERAKLNYEKVLFNLFSLDLSNVKTHLDKWQSDEGLPFWDAKKAALLAEIGHHEEAEKILERALKNVREKLNLKPVTTDYTYVSQESFIMLLYRYVKQSIDLGSGQSLTKLFADRWTALKQYECDPWQDLKFFESSLGNPISKINNVEEKQGFDIGRTTKSYHFRNWNEDALMGINFLEFCEESGIPIKIGAMTFGKKSAEGAIARIWDHFQYWSIVTTARIGDKKIVENIFSRESLIKFETTEVDSLIEIFLLAHKRNKSFILSDYGITTFNLGETLAQILSEVLSRLCCRASFAAKKRILEFVLEVYNSEKKERYCNINTLLKRLIDSLSVKQKLSIIPILLEFPCPVNLSPIAKDEFINPFLFLALELPKDSHLLNSKPAIRQEVINGVIARSNSKDTKERAWAINSLIPLFKLGFLDNPTIDKFANSLWADCKNDFPSNPELFKIDYLSLPHPANIDPKALFKEFVIKSKFPTISSNSFSINNGFIALCYEIMASSDLIDWEKSDINYIFEKLFEWWNSDKKCLDEAAKTSFPLGKEEPFKKLNNIPEILSRVIIPNPNFDKTKHTQQIDQMLKEFQDYNFPTVSLEASYIAIADTYKKSTFRKIERAFLSNDHKLIIDCLKAILIFFEKNEIRLKKADERHLLDLFCQILYWRKPFELEQFVRVLTVLVEKNFNSFHNEQIERVIIGISNLSQDTDWRNNNSVLGFHERLSIRQATARLAYVLFEQLRRFEKEVPKEILEWEEICGSENEFAEVKNQWLSI